MKSLKSIFIASLMIFSHCHTSIAREKQRLPTEFYGTVKRIIDGDTLEVKINIWPGISGNFSIRVRGIDAPEIKRHDCDEEYEWGMEAKEKVEQLYPKGSQVRLQKVKVGLYGRYVADVSRWRSDRWLYLKDELIERKLAHEWFSGQSAIPWCLLAKTR